MRRTLSEETAKTEVSASGQGCLPEIDVAKQYSTPIIDGLERSGMTEQKEHQLQQSLFREPWPGFQIRLCNAFSICQDAC